MNEVSVSNNEGDHDCASAGPGELVVHSELPEGIRIAESRFGRCLIATKKFAKGSLVYQGSCVLVEGVTDYTLRVTDSKGNITEFKLDTTNSVEDSLNPEEKDVRQFYGFDGFMNHSCDPNLYCPGTRREAFNVYYDSFALKDIEPGDEITCDYAAFDYECDGHEIAACGCGSDKCRGEMRGFKNLSLQEKLRILPYTDRDVINRFLADNPKVRLFDCPLPEGIDVHTNGDYRHLIAQRRFKTGDVVFRNKIEMLREQELGHTFLMKVKDSVTLLDKDSHFIHRPDYVEMLGFDIFMDHSCDPSTHQEYHSHTEYTVYASRDIEEGEKLTCDYNALHNATTGHESLVTIQFDCGCGTTKCRGKIRG